MKELKQVEQDLQYLSTFENNIPQNLVPGDEEHLSQLQRVANQPHINLPLVAMLLLKTNTIPYNWLNYKKQNFLHLMILHEHVELVSGLAKVCSLFQRDFRGFTPLDLAIYVNNVDIVKILIHANPTIINLLDTRTFITPLIFACICGNAEIVNCLLERYASVNDQDRCGGTALMKAAMYGNYDCAVQLVREHSLLINSRDINNFSALTLATLFRNDKIVQLLLDNSASTSSTDHLDSPFFVALVTNNIKSISTMMLYDDMLEELSGQYQQSIYHRIIMYCTEDEILTYFEMFKDRCSPKFDIKNSLQQTPLFYAAHFNYTRVMKFLVENMCDVRATDSRGNSVLHYCSSGDAVKIIYQELISICSFDELQVMLNRANKSGNTPMHVAYAFGNKEQIQLLLQSDVNINHKNDNGNIPRHMIFCERRRLLPVSRDEEAPDGGLHIGRVHLVDDGLICY